MQSKVPNAQNKFEYRTQQRQRQSWAVDWRRLVNAFNWEIQLWPGHDVIYEASPQIGKHAFVFPRSSLAFLSMNSIFPGNHDSFPFCLPSLFELCVRASGELKLILYQVWRLEIDCWMLSTSPNLLDSCKPEFKLLLRLLRLHWKVKINAVSLRVVFMRRY